jgi:hypothetical protein
MARITSTALPTFPRRRASASSASSSCRSKRHLRSRPRTYLQGIDNADIIDTVHARRAPMIPVSTSLSP